MVEDSEGKALWHRVTKTVKAYHKAKAVPQHQAKAAVKKKEEKEKPKPKAKLEKLPVINIKKETVVAKQPPQLDGSTKRKLQKGLIRPEDKIDLHGMTQVRAHNALLNFISSAVKNKLRTVLVITGKGKNFNSVLRQNLPRWLEDEKLKPYVISITVAAIKDGGEGAFYIRLKNSSKMKKEIND